ncbi:unnamed protein product [Chrysoparadoxa australica]
MGGGASLQRRPRPQVHSPRRSSLLLTGKVEQIGFTRALKRKRPGAARIVSFVDQWNHEQTVQDAKTGDLVLFRESFTIMPRLAINSLIVRGIVSTVKSSGFYAKTRMLPGWTGVGMVYKPDDEKGAKLVFGSYQGVEVRDLEEVLRLWSRTGARAALRQYTGSRGGNGATSTVERLQEHISLALGEDGVGWDAVAAAISDAEDNASPEQDMSLRDFAQEVTRLIKRQASQLPKELVNTAKRAFVTLLPPEVGHDGLDEKGCMLASAEVFQGCSSSKLRELVDKHFHELDVNGDGTLQFDEFKEMCTLIPLGLNQQIPIEHDMPGIVSGCVVGYFCCFMGLLGEKSEEMDFVADSFSSLHPDAAVLFSKSWKTEVEISDELNMANALEWKAIKVSREASKEAGLGQS